MVLIGALAIIFFTSFSFLNNTYNDFENKIISTNQIRPNTIIANKIKNREYEKININGITGATISIANNFPVFIPIIINRTNINNALEKFNSFENLQYKNFFIFDKSRDGIMSSYLKISEDKYIYLGQKFLYCNENEYQCIKDGKIQDNYLELY